MNDDMTTWRTSVCGCPACLDRRIHTSTDLDTHHPYSGHGYDRNHWSHPALEEEAARALKLEAQILLPSRWMKP